MWTEADRESSFARVSSEVSSLPAAQALPWGQHLRLSVRDSNNTTSRGFGYLWNDHHGNGRLALSIKAPAGAQQAYVASDPFHYFVPEYDVNNGWVGVHLDPDHQPDWTEISGLIEQAWRMTAPRTLVRELDSQRTGRG